MIELSSIGGRTNPDRLERMAVHRSPMGIIGESGSGCLAKKTGRVFPTLARRFLCFWLRCIRSAAVQSIAPATGWAPILGGFVLWLALRTGGWELILPDTLLGWIVVGFACLGSAWFLIFIIKAIFWEPFAQHVTAETTIATHQSELANLRSQITISIPDLSIDPRWIPEIFTSPDDDAIVHIVVRDFHLTNRSNFSASIEVRMKFNVGGMTLDPSQDDSPLGLVEAVKEQDPSIGNHLGRRISLSAQQGVTGYLSYRIFGPIIRAFAADHSMNTVDFLKSLEQTLEIQDHISGVTKSVSLRTLGPYSFRELEG